MLSFTTCSTSSSTAQSESLCHGAAQMLFSSASSMSLTTFFIFRLVSLSSLSVSRLIDFLMLL